MSSATELFERDRGWRVVGECQVAAAPAAAAHSATMFISALPVRECAHTPSVRGSMSPAPRAGEAQNVLRRMQHAVKQRTTGGAATHAAAAGPAPRQQQCRQHHALPPIPPYAHALRATQTATSLCRKERAGVFGAVEKGRQVENRE